MQQVQAQFLMHHRHYLRKHQTAIAEMVRRNVPRVITQERRILMSDNA